MKFKRNERGFTLIEMMIISNVQKREVRNVAVYLCF
ncbi:prepilin-type N-terminal cleavage/methylation domain-containing protein [Bacillus sp. OxB-1]